MRRTLTQFVAVATAFNMAAAEPRVENAALAALVKRPYLELLETAPTVAFRAEEFEAVKKQLDKERESEKNRLKKEEKELDHLLSELRDQLAALNQEASTDSPGMAERRRTLHCEIQRLEKERREKRVERQHGLDVAFDNQLAKLELVQLWPQRKKEIEEVIAGGRARLRQYGDVEDIGVRKISENQEKDVKLGEETIRDLKLYGLVPPELDRKDVTDYVQTVARRIAANSDLAVPVKVSVLQSQEINAFALPGGFLFVNTGLLERADTESELAGVMAHELAHVSARHGARLMKRANFANLMMQMAQIAAVLVSGGIAGIGMYYALQYGFAGLGLVLNLALLGVSREFEAEADQLGVQYAWRSGYDPRGFITFFDKMASEKGYVKSASFFRTHPPFFKRILSTVSEIEYLPKTGDLVVDSTEFRDFKKRLREALEKEETIRKDRPTLRKEPECEDTRPDRRPGTQPDSSTGAAPACGTCPAGE
jgi:Zn-dependent protease with chaperone function